jgi:RHS repeat-associated protein
MTAAVGARNFFKVGAGVVHALLQARYYDGGGKGEFLSEDPVFLGDPKQQVLADPQSLNSYSYGNDNPITKSDPTGLDAYYNNAGQKVFSDSRTNGVFSDAGDTAMLSSNVRSVTSGNAASNFAKRAVGE